MVRLLMLLALWLWPLAWGLPELSSTPLWVWGTCCVSQLRPSQNTTPEA